MFQPEDDKARLEMELARTQCMLITIKYVSCVWISYTECAKTPCPTFVRCWGGKTKTYCQGTICRRCVLAALRTVRLGLIKFGNQAKPLTYSEEGKKVVFRTSLGQMFKRTTPRYAADNDAAGTDVCPVRMSTLSHTSCGRLGESFVSKNELRTSQVCVL